MMAGPDGEAQPLEQRPQAGTLRLVWVGGLLTASSLGALAALMGGLPGAIQALLAAPILFGGAALPLLVRVSPPAPSGVKLGLLACLLSPPLWAALYLAGRLSLEPDSAAALGFLLVALAQPLLLGKRVHLGRPGRALWVAFGLALCGAALLAGLQLVGSRGLAGAASWHAGLAWAIERGLPPENPWLAGLAPRAAWVYEALGAALARGLGLAPTQALALLGSFSALVLPPALALTVAPLWREARRSIVSVLLALFGWSALSGWGKLAGGGVVGSAGTGAGGAELLLPGPLLPATALAAGALMCAAHALRHGRHPWVSLCALSHGLAFALHPVLGGSALLATLLAGLAFPGAPRVRPLLPLCLALAALPGLYLLRHFDLLTASPTMRGEPASALVWFAPALPLAVVSLGLLGGRWWGARETDPGPGEDDRTGRRTLLSALLMAAALPLVLPWLLSGSGALSPWSSGAVAWYEARRWAGLPLGLLAGGGLVDLFESRGLGRLALALAAAALLCLGSVAELAGSLGRELRLARRDSGLVATPLGLTGRAVCGVEEEVWSYLRLTLAFRERRPVLIVPPAGCPGFAGAHGPHPAPLLADLSLWCDREPWGGAHPRRNARREGLSRLFYDERAGYNGLVRELEALDRPGVVLVPEPLRKRALTTKLGAHGFARLREFESASLYVWPGELIEVQTRVERERAR